MTISDSALFNVDINNYNGPLDVLLDLAKAQKVDLEEISITKLADQFHDYITKEKDLNLEIASEYLLMATWLAYLKSRLLLPGTPEEEFKVQEVAEKLKLQLKKLENYIRQKRKLFLVYLKNFSGLEEPVHLYREQED